MSTTKSSNQSQKVHRRMAIEELFSLYPNKAKLLYDEMAKAGLNCAGCQAAAWENLEDGMKNHGWSEEAIDQFIEHLNTVLEEKVDMTKVSITKNAAQKYLQILDEEGKHGWGLRFDIESAGCSGFDYVLDYSESAGPEDTVFTSQEIEIHVKTDVVPEILGSEIDYVEGPTGTGFRVSNPNVKSGCGCGKNNCC